MKKEVGFQVLDADEAEALRKLSEPSVKVAEAHKPGKFNKDAADALWKRWKRQTKLSVQKKLDGFRVQVFVRMLEDNSFVIKVGTGSWKRLPNNQVVNDVTRSVAKLVEANRVLDLLMQLPPVERVMLFDGEIETYGTNVHGEKVVDSFSTIQQKLTTEDATGVVFTYTLFDIVCAHPSTIISPKVRVSKDQPNRAFSIYEERLELLTSLVSEVAPDNVKVIEEVERISIEHFESGDNMMEYVQGVYDDLATQDSSLEGLVVWNLSMCYRAKRAGVKNPTLFKLKPFEDAEAVVLGAIPLERNSAEAETMSTGKSRKSHRKEDMVVDEERVGALEVVSPEVGVFNLGVGFTDEMRLAMMEMHRRGELRGRIVAYTHQVAGAKLKRRLPVFRGFREPIDIDPDKLAALLEVMPEGCEQ